MRPAHFLTILFATTLLIGCGSNVVDMTQLANEDGEGFRYWYGDDLSEGLFYLKGKPFTGLAELVGEQYFDYPVDREVLSLRIPFKKGRIDFSAGWEAFYASGQIAARCSEWLARLNSRLKRFSLSEHACYNGRFETWYMTGQMSSRINYKEGDIDGLEEEWYENGQMALRVNSKEGDIDGLVERWYENGQMSLRRNFKEGDIDGLEEEWYENGQMSSRINYKEGDMDGLYETWYENGQLLRRANYMEGDVDGLYEAWYENGQMAQRANFKEGDIDGLKEEWYENGQPK